MQLAKHYYTTLEAVLQHLDTGVTITGGDLLMSTESGVVDLQFIWELIPAVSAMMTINSGVSFVPVRRDHFIRKHRLFDLNTLLLPDTPYDLTVVRNGDSTDVTSDVLWYAGAINTSPFLIYNDGTWVFEPTEYVYVSGTFCFAPDPLQTRQVLEDVDLDDTATELTLTSVDGLERGDLLMVIHELLLITDIDTPAKKITFTRGANGSGIADHGTQPLIKFLVNPMVKRLATEIVAWFIKNRHRVNELYQAPQGGQVKVGGLDPDIWKQLGMFAPITRDMDYYR